MAFAKTFAGAAAAIALTAATLHTPARAQVPIPEAAIPWWLVPAFASLLGALVAINDRKDLRPVSP